jgi:N-acyl-D-amino-acid deacylase
MGRSVSPELPMLVSKQRAASYMPVSPLMVYVMGLEAAKSRPAMPAERKEMQRLLNEAMDAGACGFSIQRLGPHSSQADV